MKKLCNDDERIVVAYKGSVYDVTEFTGHPGGVGRLQMAAGGDLEVYWKIYTQHNRGHIVESVLAPYKIGVVSDEDMNRITANTFYDNSAYQDDPAPFPDLLMNTRHPYNAEARLSELTDSFITPAGRHFVRNHSAVPNIDPEEYVLTVTGDGSTGVATTTFSLEDLKNKFQKHNVTTVIQCNGNRREDYHYYDGETPAFGPPHWVAGAIGCATWSGPRLPSSSGAMTLNTARRTVNCTISPRILRSLTTSGMTLLMQVSRLTSRTSCCIGLPRPPMSHHSTRILATLTQV